MNLDFNEFYPKYLEAHSQSGTKAFHFSGVTGFLVLTVLAVVFTNPLLFLAGIGLGYGLSWLGHHFIEKNDPLSLQSVDSALLAIPSAFKMWFELLTGKLNF